MQSPGSMRKRQLQRIAFNALRAGQREEAILTYQTLLSLLESSDVKERMLANWGLGSAYIALDRYAEALLAFEEVLQDLQFVPYPEMEAGCLASLAQAHAFLGQHQEAISYCTQAISAYRHLNNLSEAARWINNLGLSYEKLERFEQARKTYEEALRAAKEAQAQNLEASALGNLGQLYIKDLGDAVKGIQYLEGVLSIFRSLEDNGSVAKTLANIGSAKMVRLGEVGAAIELFREAQMLARYTNNDTLLAHLYNLMDTAVSHLEPVDEEIGSENEDTTQGDKAGKTSHETNWDFLLSLGDDGKEKTANQ